ncbi:MAG: hypothetical protein NTW59_04415 [Candidatus Diapherotrites archaeon]|nr:hypothetical protein [Candidatus Diapherotrites archaeon]
MRRTQNPKRQWMPRFKRLGAKRLPTAVRQQSLRKIFHGARLKYYSAKGSNIFAVGCLPYVAGDGRMMVIAKLNPRTGGFERFARANLGVPLGKAVDISDATMLPEKKVPGKHPALGTVDLYAPRKSGFNFFRQVLNEAIALAKEKGLHAVTLTPQNLELKRYYRRFGFRFPAGSGTGVFRLR